MNPTENIKRSRKIQRGAMLCEASGSPENLLAYLPEIQAKGYDSVVFFPTVGDAVILEPLCHEADRLGLSVWILTGYMKYQEEYLVDHPEQRLVLAKDAHDQDALSVASWGCPFHPEFKERYFDFLRAFCKYPAITRIALNDEAFLMSGCYCAYCREAYRSEIGGDMPCKPEPCAADWEDPVWREFLHWRILRWNRVHGEMADVIHGENPAIKAGFLTSPCVELWLNPWRTGVDLSTMIERIDGITVDPYYTFHPRHFDPAEAYLSEWCRLLACIVPEGKYAEIVPQGFSHPTFTRPLDEGDGYWAALIPPACGIREITPYCYPYLKVSPMLETYEQCFRWDGYFAEAAPLNYAAVVHGGRSEIYHHPFPDELPDSYDGAFFMPVGESLRHRGIPYQYLTDGNLDDPGKLGKYAVIILPQITCLSDQAAKAILRYVDEGGGLVILGDLGPCDEYGTARTSSLLWETFGIKITAKVEAPRGLCLNLEHPSLQERETFDELGAARYRGGAVIPVTVLNRCLNADLPEDVEILARYENGEGACEGRTAIAALSHGRGRVVWMGGFPSRNAVNPRSSLTVKNLAPSIMASVVKWVAKEKPKLRVDGWPPEVPIGRLRPFDQRNFSTFEFFPLVGDGHYLGLVTSYFKEPTEFTMTATIPSDQKVVKVLELIDDTPVPFEHEGEEVSIVVRMTPNTPALLYLFELAPKN